MKAFVPSSKVRFLTVIFHVKIKLFMTLKSDQNVHPHGLSLVWLPGFGSALR
jgi:hypothetical protein